MCPYFSSSDWSTNVQKPAILGAVYVKVDDTDLGVVKLYWAERSKKGVC